MQQSLFLDGFIPVTRFDLTDIANAKRTITYLEKKGQTEGISICEVEQFLRALAVIKRYPEWVTQI